MADEMTLLTICVGFRDFLEHVLTLSALDPTSDRSTHQRFGPKRFWGLDITLALIMIGEKLNPKQTGWSTLP